MQSELNIVSPSCSALLILDINGPPQESTEGDIPEKSWPSKGGIKVEGFSVRYGIDLPDVLHEVSFEVEVRTAFDIADDSLDNELGLLVLPVRASRLWR